MDAASTFLEIRRALGLNQSAFADIFGKGQSWTTKIETGRSVGLDEAIHVIRILVKDHNVNPDYILFGQLPILRTGISPNRTEPPITLEALFDRVRNLEDFTGIFSQENS